MYVDIYIYMYIYICIYIYIHWNLAFTQFSLQFISCWLRFSDTPGLSLVGSKAIKFCIIELNWQKLGTPKLYDLH